MFNYYLGLALRSLKRNIVLTVLMIAAIGVGIGASMTTLTVFRAMDNDPIPREVAATVRRTDRQLGTRSKSDRSPATRTICRRRSAISMRWV